MFCLPPFYLTHVKNDSGPSVSILSLKSWSTETVYILPGMGTADLYSTSRNNTCSTTEWDATPHETQEVNVLTLNLQDLTHQKLVSQREWGRGTRALHLHSSQTRHNSCPSDRATPTHTESEYAGPSYMYTAKSSFYSKW